MDIIRDGKTYTLTEEEVAMAHAEFVTAFMEKELINSYDMDEQEAKEAAKSAYDLYCEGDGKTEYECIEQACNEYTNTNTENEDDTESFWSEIRNSYVDDDNICYIDAWKSSDDNEEGSVIAYVDMNAGKVIYVNPLAVHDEYAQSIINETIANARELHRLDTSLPSRTSLNFIKELWMQFGEVPMNPETENLEENWLLFPRGTNREEIWDWFEEEFDVSVATDLMHI